MSSSRGQSPCDTGPRELRLDVISPGTLARCLATERRTGLTGINYAHVGNTGARKRRFDARLAEAAIASCCDAQRTRGAASWIDVKCGR